MSTKIGEIKGIYLKTNKNNPYKSDEIPARLDINRYYGGKEKGRMLQLTTISNEISYICLTQEQVYELAQILTDSFNDDIYPSD